MSLNDLITYSVDVNGQNCHTKTATQTATNNTIRQIQEDRTGEKTKNTKNPKNSSHLLNKHIKECCIKRGLDRHWIEAGCSSLTATEASQELHYTAKSPGILIEGANGQDQFKPDQPWADKQGKKAPKYRTAAGDEYDALLPKHPTDSNYWNNIPQLKERCYKINDHPLLLITEGGFKAIAPCSHSIPTIALMGVEMGLTSSKNDPQGKRYLVPALEYYARAGFGFIFGFDADTYTKKPVLKALIKLAEALKKFDVPLYTLPKWSESEGKGIDDYIQNNGIEKFRNNLMNYCLDYSSWHELYGKDAFDNKIPKADFLGKRIAEEYRNKFVYSDEYKSWLAYGLVTVGIWERISPDYMAAQVNGILNARGIEGYGSDSYIKNIVAKLKHELFLKQWDEKSSAQWLPFRNGVLELASNKLHEHSPDFHFTWQLPRDYTVVETGWQCIDRWLAEATKGNAEHKQMLLHFAAAVLRGRSDLQKFLHLIGGGGSGKSTFTTLLTALIGEENTVNLNLSDLEDKHEIARIFGKRLLLLPDQDKASKKMSNFKRLTGHDKLSGRRLFENGFEFFFEGLTVMTSNSPVFHSHLGSWLTRRGIVIPFEYECPPQKKRDLMREFEPELGAFTSYLLSISDAEIDETFKGVKSKTLSATAWESLIRNDGLAAWVNDRVIRDDNAKAFIGSNSREWLKDEEYNASISTLYGSYALYCRQSNRSIKSTQNFSAEFLELTNRILGWNASKTRTTYKGKNGWVIKGLRLRTNSDNHNLTTEELLIQNQHDNSSDNQNDISNDISKSPPSKGFDNSDNLDRENRENKNNLLNDCDSSLTGTVIEEVVKNNHVVSQPDEEVTPVTSPTEKAFEAITEVVTSSVTPVVIKDKDTSSGETLDALDLRIDWQTYPYQSQDTDTLKNRGMKVRERILACTTQNDLITLFAENKASEIEVEWLQENLLTQSEVVNVKSAWATKQGNLFNQPEVKAEERDDESPAQDESESKFRVGDLVKIKGTKITGVLVKYYAAGQSWIIRTSKGFSQPQEYRSEDMLELLA